MLSFSKLTSLNAQPTPSSNMSECKGCKFSKDLKGCAAHHADTARKLIAEGKITDADKSLKGLQDHLKE